jgi:hypothetical protein
MTQIVIENGTVIHVPKSNCIGVIIDSGKDHCRWYRSTSDGVVEQDEFVLVQTQKHYYQLLSSGAKTAPSDAERIKEKLKLR